MPSRDDARLHGLQLVGPFDPRRAIDLQVKIQRALIAIRPLVSGCRPSFTSCQKGSSLGPIGRRPVGQHASVAIGAGGNFSSTTPLRPRHFLNKRDDAFAGRGDMKRTKDVGNACDTIRGIGATSAETNAPARIQSSSVCSVAGSTQSPAPSASGF